MRLWWLLAVLLVMCGSVLAVIKMPVRHSDSETTGFEQEAWGTPAPEHLIKCEHQEEFSKEFIEESERKYRESIGETAETPKIQEESKKEKDNGKVE